MERLREELLELKNNHFLAGIKGGTEVEGMSFEEISLMRGLSIDILPMTVKIGGVEARNDMDFMLNIGIDKILAPMIESAYGLKNFVETIKLLDDNNAVSLAINIETITAYHNLESIIRSPFFNYIEQVTVGRSDLSASMEKDVDDEEVNKTTKEIVDQAKYYNKKTSVGGKINSVNSIYIKNIIKSDYINTRHMMISCHSNDITTDINAALLWEKKFYQYLEERIPVRRNFYNNRIVSVESRITDELLLKN